MTTLSKPARPVAGLILNKTLALIGLALLCACLLAPPAHAQSSAWYAQPCDANGNSIYAYADSNGFYPPRGPISGTATNTYPAPMNAYIAANPNDSTWYSAAFPLYWSSFSSTEYFIGPSFLADSPGTNATNSAGYGGMTAFFPYQDTQGVSQTAAINGSVTTDVTGQLVAYFKWMPNGDAAPTPMPDHMNLLLKATLRADTNFYSSGV